MDIQLCLRPLQESCDERPLLPEALLGVDVFEEPRPPPVTEGVQRYAWQSRFGAMLIELRQRSADVNGQRFDPLGFPLPSLA